ncbi:MAG: formate dehydrogenase family accessory protein FdhD [Desulfuromonas sp.]|nr:MAG: formate dehydrogenase family accessory protein FdhD [Desulfuromonas sp.]
MKRKIIELSPDGCKEKESLVAAEKLFRVNINGRDLLTLVASPHEPEVLVTGFLYLQGMIAAPDDIIALGICSDSGQVAVTVRKELPESLLPIISSGCGGGIVFAEGSVPAVGATGQSFPAGDAALAIRQGMARLLAVAEQYSAHGGIHSAAICDCTGLLLHAEDLGRHNTIDRLAGAALRQRIDVSGKLLLTSGRISSEMVAKAIRLGVKVLASRTSPTDLAVELCCDHGVGLAGYVRGGSMEVYTHPEQFTA